MKLILIGKYIWQQPIDEEDISHRQNLEFLVLGQRGGKRERQRPAWKGNNVQEGEAGPPHEGHKSQECCSVESTLARTEHRN